MFLQSIKRKTNYLGKVAKHLIAKDSIAYLILFVTDQCNAQCQMCFSSDGMANKKKHREILSLEDIERLLLQEKLKNIVQFTISGGEPFLREDIEDILKLYSRLHPFSRITIPTNGILTDRIANILGRFIPENQALEINLPLTILGIGEKHNQITNVNNHFKKLNQTIQALQPLRADPNFTLSCVTVLSSFNQYQMKEITDFLKQKQAYFDSFNILLTRGIPRNPVSSDIDHSVFVKYRSKLPNKRIFINLLVHTLWRLIDYEIKYKKMDIYCNAGRKLLVIGERGDVFPCELIHYFADPFIGNLFEYDFDLDAILNSKYAKEIKQLIKNKQCHCSFECAILSSIIFSPSNYGAFIKTLFRGK